MANRRTFLKAVAVGAAAARVSASDRVRTEAMTDEGYQQVRDQFVPHVRDFLESNRTPWDRELRAVVSGA